MFKSVVERKHIQRLEWKTICVFTCIHSSVIRQKGESKNGCFKRRKYAKISPKTNISYPPDTHTYVCVSESKKCSFFGQFWHALFSWNTRFETRIFALLPMHSIFIKSELGLSTMNQSWKIVAGKSFCRY